MAGWVDVPVDGSWPSPRFSHMAVMHGRNMWIFGGVVQQGLSNELWALDTGTANWTGWLALTPGPTARESMTLVALLGRLWLYGGYDGSFCGDLWALDVEGEPRWSQVEAHRMWLFGGIDAVNASEELWLLEMPKGEGWQSEPRSGHHLTELGARRDELPV
eukprot:Skav206424  [mRNA]  locus=scaffold292:464590:468402:- [translate_table: standard]